VSKGNEHVSAIKAVTDDRFDADVLASPRPVIVECWAEWCPPCRQVAPVMEAIAAEHAGEFDVVTLNVDENPRTAMRYGIMAVPTLSLFSGGELVKQVVGARSKAALLREFAAHLPAPV
jgi:thioredoxin 1